jgi:hypothetical protein
VKSFPAIALRVLSAATKRRLWEKQVSLLSKTMGGCFKNQSSENRTLGYAHALRAWISNTRSSSHQRNGAGIARVSLLLSKTLAHEPKCISNALEHGPLMVRAQDAIALDERSCFHDRYLSSFLPKFRWFIVFSPCAGLSLVHSARVIPKRAGLSD